MNDYGDIGSVLASQRHLPKCARCQAERHLIVACQGPLGHPCATSPQSLWIVHLDQPSRFAVEQSGWANEGAGLPAHQPTQQRDPVAFV